MGVYDGLDLVTSPSFCYIKSKTIVVLFIYLSTVAIIVLYISALPPKILPQIPKDPGPDPKTQSMLSSAPWSRSCLLLLPLLHVLPHLLPFGMP